MGFRCFPALHVILTLAFLTGCASPSPRFTGAQRHEVEIGGSRFIVFSRGDEAEVYRTSLEFMPRLSTVLGHARQAIIRATGCTVREGSLEGDAALIRARLNCTGAPLPPEPERVEITIRCEGVDQWMVGGTTEVTAIECVQQ